MKHTSGPWEIDWEVSESGPAICGKNGFIFCQVYGDNDKFEANANLIAAAPELLRELKSAIFYIETYSGEVTSNFSSGGNMDAVKAIIKKAEGETS